MATIWHLRQRLIADFDVQGAAEEMLVDLAVLAFHNALRVQKWIGDAGMLLEAELFGQAGPSATLEAKYGPGSVTGLAAEEWVRRLTESLVPLLDRTNRMLIRNLRALRELKGAPLAVRVENYGQLNVGQTQTNTAATTQEQRVPPSAPRRRRPPRQEASQ